MLRESGGASFLPRSILRGDSLGHHSLKGPPLFAAQSTPSLPVLESLLTHLTPSGRHTSAPLSPSPLPSQPRGGRRLQTAHLKRAAGAAHRGEVLRS